MIRPATLDDLDAMLALGAAMHTESPAYDYMPWAADKVRALMASLIASPDGLALVAERDGEIVGGFIGMVFEHFFSTALVAQDFALFVSPDKRGGLLGAQLLKAYVAWARSRGAVKIQQGITTGVHEAASARLCEAVGFRPAGTLFEFSGEALCA